MRLPWARGGPGGRRRGSLRYAVGMTTTKRIGILTAGGDCPGLNAVIRSVSRCAIARGIEVHGIADGYLGLMEDRVERLTDERLSGILTRGGTILGTSNKCDPSRYAEGRDSAGNIVFEDRTMACLETVARHALDAVVVAGGDGSMTVASKLIAFAESKARPMNFIGMPKTIDNDLWGSELTFGFQTAVSIATEALDRLHTTAASHHRVMVVEVMGRNAGWIALHAGVAAGADIILIPEIPFHLDRVCGAAIERRRRGKHFTIVCVAEGAKPAGGAQFVARNDPTSPDPIRLGGVAKYLSDEIEGATGFESRHVVLGHVQRGGTPIAADRELGTRLGFHAVEMLLGGKRNRVAVIQQGRVTDIALAVSARQRTVPPDDELLRAARGIGIGFGD